MGWSKHCILRDVYCIVWAGAWCRPSVLRSDLEQFEIIRCFPVQIWIGPSQKDSLPRCASIFLSHAFQFIAYCSKYTYIYISTYVCFKDITPIFTQMYMYIRPFKKRVISTQQFVGCLGFLARQTSALWPTFAGIGLTVGRSPSWFS